jgi:hypothetical protein
VAGFIWQKAGRGWHHHSCGAIPWVFALVRG